jgi:hypothetical protein
MLSINLLLTLIFTPLHGLATVHTIALRLFVWMPCSTAAATACDLCTSCSTCWLLPLPPVERMLLFGAAVYV